MMTTMLCFLILLILLVLTGLTTYLVWLVRAQGETAEARSESAETQQAELMQAVSKISPLPHSSKTKPRVKKPAPHAQPVVQGDAPPLPHPPSEHLGHMVADLQNNHPIPPPFVSGGTQTEAIRYSTIPCPSCDYVHMVNMVDEKKRYICPKCNQPIEID